MSSRPFGAREAQQPRLGRRSGSRLPAGRTSAFYFNDTWWLVVNNVV